MKAGQTILLVGAGIVAYSLYRKATGGGSLVWYPKGIKQLNFQSGSPVLELNLGVGNPTNQSFSLQAIAGNLYTNGTYIGYISSFGTINLPARSEALIPIKIRLSLIGVVSQLIDGLTQGTWSQALELDMKANVDHLLVPVNIKYKIGK